MAQKIEAWGQQPKPTDAGQLIRKEEWGIDNALANCIIQTENVTEDRSTDTTYDQKGAVASQLDYDKHWTLQLDVIGDSALLPFTGDSSAADVGDIAFNYGGHNWKLQSCAYTGSYQDKKKYVLNAERWMWFPDQPTP